MFYVPSFSAIYLANESRVRNFAPFDQLENGPIFLAHEVGHALIDSKSPKANHKPEGCFEMDIDQDLTLEREAWANGICWWRRMEEKHGVTFWSGSAKALTEVVDLNLWSLLVSKFGPLVKLTHGGIRDADLNYSIYRQARDKLGIR